MQGLVTLRDKIATLKEQIDKLTEVVGPVRERQLRQPLDPKRTVFVTDPPREFPSVAAMMFFLDLEENRETKAKHAAFNKQATSAPATV
jgi:hypothetical protein